MYQGMIGGGDGMDGIFTYVSVIKKYNLMLLM